MDKSFVVVVVVFRFLLSKLYIGLTFATLLRKRYD